VSRYLLTLAALFMCASCSLKTPDHFNARQSSFGHLAGWMEDDHRQALKVFLDSCPLMVRKAPPASPASGLHVSKDVWKSLCDDAAQSQETREAARMFFERRFTLYAVQNNGRTDGLFTGYYEPLLYGSYKKHGDFRYPIYAKPPELKGDKPYYTRAEIDGGKLAGRGLEIVWVDDPVMLFFMHIQGSGRIRLENGRDINIGFAARNNRDYVSLGKVIGDEGILPKDKIDFFSIREWMYKNPKRAMKLMQRNPSYIFFKKRAAAGAVGSVGSVLTPMRSIAIDNAYIPYGLPLFLETDLPATPARGPARFNRIMVAQDTGTAIKGPVRGDIFFGPGKNAEHYAGAMKNKGRYTLLFPKEIAYQLK
jgi:membrane-bound lytic murein transglycosylase A